MEKIFIALIVIGALMVLLSNVKTHKDRPPKYPRVIGHEGVWCNGYTNKEGETIPAGHEFTIVEVKENDIRFVEHGKKCEGKRYQ